MRALRLSTCALMWWAVGSVAHADPITAIIVTAVNVIGGATIAAAVGNFLIVAGSTIYSAAASWGLSKLLGRAAGGSVTQSTQERQASVLQMNVGEQPREMLVGETANGGTLGGVFNYGGQYGTDRLVRVILLADHVCEKLVGVYVGEDFKEYVDDGPVDGYDGRLNLYWRNGAAGNTFPESLLSAWQASPYHSETAPSSVNCYTGQAYLVVEIIADPETSENPIWAGSPPAMLPVVRGKRCYDPRKDSSVGGFGPHRWTDPSTWEWTRNLSVIRYNWMRGVYALDLVDQPEMLLVGRGLSDLEAPPQNVFAYANLCDELVDDGDGGTEPRYFADGVIRANDPYSTVEDWFKDACGGVIFQPQGGIEVEPGHAKTPVYQITDADLVAGADVEFDEFGSDADRVNTVVARYVEPGQRYGDAGAPVQRLDTIDIINDGGGKELSLPLLLVTRVTQAQRVGRIKLRGLQLEKSGAIVMGPRFAEGEEGDWIEWTSDRYTRGEPVVFRIEDQSMDATWRSAWALREIAFEVYGFGGSPLPASGGITPPPAIEALALVGVNAVGIMINGEDASAVPAIRFVWDTPVDPAMIAIRAEVRAAGETAGTPTLVYGLSDGEVTVTNGVGSAALMQARLVPVGPRGRAIVPSDWVNVTTGPLAAGLNEIAAEVVEAVRELADRGDTLVEGVRNRIDRLLALIDTVSIGSLQAALDEQRHRSALAEKIYVDGVPVSVYAANETLARIDGQTALSGEISIWTATVGTNQAQALLAYAAFASANTAQTEARLALTATVGANRSEALLAITGVANDLSAETAARLALASTVGSNQAAALLEITTVANNLSTQAGLLAALTTSYNGNVSTVATQLSSLTSSTGALSSAQTALSTTVGGHTSTLSVYGASIDGLKAQWGFALTSGNEVAGINSLLYGSRSTIDFLFNVVRYVDPNTGNPIPWFVYEDGLARFNVPLKLGVVITDWLANGAASASVVAEFAGTIPRDIELDVVLAEASIIAVGDTVQILFYATFLAPQSRDHGYIQLYRNGVPVGRIQHISLDGQNIVSQTLTFVDTGADDNDWNDYSIVKLSGNFGFEGRVISLTNHKKSA